MTDWKVTQVLDWEAFIGTKTGGLDIAIVHRASTFADHYDAQYDGLCISDEEWKSLVQLISAAPELLAALRLARDDLSDLLDFADLTDKRMADTTEVLYKVMAAIDKAEGRGE